MDNKKKAAAPAVGKKKNNTARINDIRRSSASCFIMGGVFAVFFAAFAIGTNFGKDREFSEMENRNLTRKPDFSADALFSGEYGKKTEEYLSDQVFMKDGLMALKTDFDYFSGKTYQNGVYFSKGGILLQRYTEDKLNISKNVGYINDFAASAGLPIDMILVPNSVCINADRLPAAAVTDDQLDTIASVSSQLSERVTLYQPYELLKSLQNEQGVKAYYSTDHHWTASAARAVCDGWLTSKGMEVTDENYIYNEVPDFYGTLYSKAPAGFIRPDTFGYYTNPDGVYQVNYIAENRYTYSMMDESFFDKKDKYASFFGGNFAHMRVERTNDVSDGSKERLLVVKDSYANSMIPFLADRFETVDVVDLRYFHTGSISDIIRENSIDRVLFVYNVDFFNEDRNFMWM